MTFHIEKSGSDLGVGFTNNIFFKYSDTIFEEDTHAKSFDCIIEITDVLKIVGVTKWEDLKGKYVRAETKDSRGIISKFEPALENRWLSINEFLET